MPRLAALLMCLLIPVSCTSPRLLGDGPYDSHEDGDGLRPGGLRYYVGKDLVVVTGTRTTKTEGVVLLRAKEEEEAVVKRVTTTSEGTVGIQTVPDTDRVFRLEMQPGGTSDDTLGVVLRGGGILKSVNVVSHSRAGDILKNVTKFAGTVAGAALGRRDLARVAAAEAGPSPAKKLEDILNSLVKKEFKGILGLPELRFVARLAASRVSRLRPEERLVLVRSSHARSLMAETLALDALLLARQRDRMVLNRVLSTSKSDDLSAGNLTILTGRVKALSVAMETLGKERDAAYAGLASEITRYFASAGAGAATRRSAFRRVIGVPDIPSSSVLASGGQPGAECPGGSVVTSLANYEAMRRLFEETGVLLTLTPAPKGMIASDGGLGVGPFSPTPPGVPECTGRVFYRQSYPAVLSTWVRSQVEHEFPVPPEGQTEAIEDADLRTLCRGADVLQLVRQEIVEIMDPRSRVEYLAFDPVAFAQHDLKLTFDNKSRLLGLTRATTSAAAGLTGALAESASGLRDEVATTLSKMAEIDANQRKLALSSLETQAQALKKRKAIVDDRIAVQGATASEASLLEQKRLEQELALLGARTNLAAAQNTQDLPSELERLRARIDALTLELAAMRQKQAQSDDD